MKVRQQLFGVLRRIARVMVGIPIEAKASARVRAYFRSVGHEVFSSERLAAREMRSVRRRPETFVQGFFFHLATRRSYEYLAGPGGWSGDAHSSRRHNCDLDFYGLLSQLASHANRTASQFTIRHELQHEMQRFRDGLHDAMCETLRSRFPFELDANVAAWRFVLRSLGITPSAIALAITGPIWALQSLCSSASTAQRVLAIFGFVGAVCAIVYVSPLEQLWVASAVCFATGVLILVYRFAVSH